MPSLKKFSLAGTVLVLAALLLVPTGAGAQRPGRDCDRNPNDSLCRQIKKRQEVNDRLKGITPACRAAYNSYSTAKQTRLRIASGVKQYKAALKKSKTEKAKKKNAKGLKKYKKLLAKAKKTEAAKLKARAGGCVGSNVPA